MKLLKLPSCYWCAHFNETYKLCLYDADEPLGDGKKITEDELLNNFPAWCPLPDAEE